MRHRMGQRQETGQHLFASVQEEWSQQEAARRLVVVE